MTSLKYLLALCLGVFLITSASAFTLCTQDLVPSFSNKIETSSSMSLKVANVNTQLGNNYISSGVSDGVEIYNNVQVSPYTKDVASVGSVSAFIKGSIMEGGRDTFSTMSTKDISSFNPVSGKMDYLEGYSASYEKPQALYQTVSFFDHTSMSGDIFDFTKFMSYKTGFS